MNKSKSDPYIVKFTRYLNAIRKAQHTERAELLLAKLLSRHLPPWFIPMLNDDNRNNFYETMIKNHVKGKTVLEIGAGVGYLSLLAAENGATEVYACELNPLMYYLAKENIEKSPYANNIHLYYGHSDILKLGNHLPEKVDIIISELISSDIFSEYMAPTLSNAKKFLKDDGIYLPTEVEAFGCLIELETELPAKIKSSNKVFESIKKLSTSRSIYLDLNLFPFNVISKPQKLFSLLDGYRCSPPLPLEFTIAKNKKSKNTYLCVYFSINDGEIKLPNLDIKNKKNNCHWENIIWELDNSKKDFDLKLINQNERLLLRSN